MSGDETDGDAGLYTRLFGNPRFPEEAYGYWITVTGALLGLAGVLFLLLGTTAGRGSPVFWTARQVAVVLGGAGIPFLVLGSVYRLPVSEGVRRTAVVGTVICLLALAGFVRFYPDYWNVQPGSPVTDWSSRIIAVYAFGFLSVVFSATVLPVMAEKRDEVVADTPESDATFEIFRDVSADWRWLLRDGEGCTVADSDEGYSSEKGAETSVESFQKDVAGASVETRDVLDEYLRSGETAVVEDTDEADEELDRVQPSLETTEEEEEMEDEHVDARQHAEFDFYEEEDQIRWCLVGSEGDVIAVSSQGYASRSEATEDVEVLRRAEEVNVRFAETETLEDEDAHFVVQRTDADGWEWMFVASDGRTLALPYEEETYAGREEAVSAVERVRKHAPDAVIG